MLFAAYFTFLKLGQKLGTFAPYHKLLVVFLIDLARIVLQKCHDRHPRYSVTKTTISCPSGNAFSIKEKAFSNSSNAASSSRISCSCFDQTPVFARQTFLLLPHCQPLPPAAFASVMHTTHPLSFCNLPPSQNAC